MFPSLALFRSVSTRNITLPSCSMAHSPASLGFMRRLIHRTFFLHAVVSVEAAERISGSRRFALLKAIMNNTLWIVLGRFEADTTITEGAII